MNITELRRALVEIGRFLEWEQDLIDHYHAYARQFGCPAGGNIHKFVLEDALRFRGLSLQRFQTQVKGWFEDPNYNAAVFQEAAKRTIAKRRNK